MTVLNEAMTRREYKTRWQALSRAKARGLNVDLMDRLYAELKKRGYGIEFARAGVFYAAREGMFGVIR